MHDADRCPQLDSIFVIVVVCRRKQQLTRGRKPSPVAGAATVVVAWWCNYCEAIINKMGGETKRTTHNKQQTTANASTM